MDITPAQLRDCEIKEAWRGYSRDEVDELLLRSASTIESQLFKIRETEDRLARLELNMEKTSETEEILRRTLLLAQKTADEAVAQGEATAAQTTELAEKTAADLVERATTSARETTQAAEARLAQLITDGERMVREAALAEQERVTAETSALVGRRDTLARDASVLEEFLDTRRTGLRSGLEAAIEALAVLERGEIPALSAEPSFSAPGAGNEALVQEVPAVHPASFAPLIGDDVDEAARRIMAIAADETLAAEALSPDTQLLDTQLLDTQLLDTQLIEIQPVEAAQFQGALLDEFPTDWSAQSAREGSSDPYAALAAEDSPPSEPMHLDDDEFFAALRAPQGGPPSGDPSDSGQSAGPNMSVFDQDQP